ncbi:hypothetical protein FH609_007035 [Streptomyces sp. 3MP-14]|uniref:Uncharacterized protein n=1 Tax=Streptomyces mimosae TaxID=2586635 RepID=A0A5N6AL99_9ACTN|nr:MULTISPECIES: hypothetical protein [Streptomyces]KAB8168833.1 hypothetical protein FH607_006330 [Streptomyces mimosae]KAB8177887.1 hypothetical protein FH609_007035 [Streptomyces sp. 3MP-14]
MARHDAEAFHATEHDQPATELGDAVRRLHEEGRYATALDLVLRQLRDVGPSEDAFFWATTLLFTTQHATGPDVAEPVPRERRSNPYFAPVATECAACARFWFSSHPALANVRLNVANPIGVQCQSCRYSLCRACYDPADARCPEPGCRGTLGVPVLPTGRPQGSPANPFTEKLEHVLILWRNTPVDREEAEFLVDLACTWQDRAGIVVRSQVNQADERDGETSERRMGLVLVGLYERLGQISEGGLLERTRVVPIMSPGHGRRLVLVTAAPETGPASQLSGPVRYLLSDDEDSENGDGIGGSAGAGSGRRRRWFRRRR